MIRFFAVIIARYTYHAATLFDAAATRACRLPRHAYAWYDSADAATRCVD